MDIVSRLPLGALLQESNMTYYNVSSIAEIVGLCNQAPAPPSSFRQREWLLIDEEGQCSSVVVSSTH